jgi:high affinity Mn2+ porin
LFFPSPSPSSTGFGSLFGGVQVGYNQLLLSRILLGVEADVSFPNFLDDGIVTLRPTPATLTTEKLDFVSTLRGRVGYAFNPWLLYVTGGLAWAQARFLESPGVGNDEDKALRIRTGWALGAGVEVPIAAAWTARLEYIYDYLGSVHAAFPSGIGHESGSMSLGTVRLGLNRQFGAYNNGAVNSSNQWALDPYVWNIHGQFTYIDQGYPTFRSPYQGTNSLYGDAQAKNTTTATAYLGLRLWEGTEFYINPELDQGGGLSNTLGVAGFPSGEAQKAAFPVARLNIDRVFLRQTFGLGGEQEAIPDGPNQLAGKQDISRVTVTVGKLSVGDAFGLNTYAFDPRTQFFNWNIYGSGSYDWVMDKIGWTWGAIVDLNQKHWAFRVGYLLEPTISNVNNFDMHIPVRGQYLAEFEWRYSLFDQPGKVRVLGWLNHATMGSYSAAVAQPPTTDNYPDITLTRQLRTNYGFVLNVEQAINEDVGVFSRASWSPGLVEIMGWTECDESLSFGMQMKGTGWERPEDRIGIAGVVEGLSGEARAYFAAGGLGVLIGDGQLNYRPEKILEAYYAYRLGKWTTLTFDYQYVVNPAYNADRGPVSIFTGRLHAEF